MHRPLSTSEKADLESRVLMHEGNCLDYLKSEPFKKLLALHGGKVDIFLGDAPYNHKAGEH